MPLSAYSSFRVLKEEFYNNFRQFPNQVKWSQDNFLKYIIGILSVPLQGNKIHIVH